MSSLLFLNPRLSFQSHSGVCVCVRHVCCVYPVLQLQRRGSTMSSSPMPPVGRLGQYEIKGLLLSFLHIIKTLSEGGVTRAFPKSPGTRNRGLKHCTKGVRVDHLAALLQFAAVFHSGGF